MPNPSTCHFLPDGSHLIGVDCDHFSRTWPDSLSGLTHKYRKVVIGPIMTRLRFFLRINFEFWVAVRAFSDWHVVTLNLKTKVLNLITTNVKISY